MVTGARHADLDEQQLSDGQSWYDLYNWLLPLVEMWVRDSGVTSWYGQHREIAEDIAHEAVMRTFRYNQRADRGEMPAVGSLKALCRVIALNYFRDWRKKDRCLVRPTLSSSAYDLSLIVREAVDAAQVALDHLIMDSIIVTVAQVVATFPRGQRIALLTDLANMSELDGEPSQLEQALSNVGLRLSDYKRPRSDDPTERGRYAALRSIAYKRLKHEIQI